MLIEAFRYEFLRFFAFFILFIFYYYFFLSTEHVAQDKTFPIQGSR